jgi:hypothetical protein
MTSKTLKFSLITLAVIALFACGQKKNEKMPEMFSSLISLHAMPASSGYLPFEIFVENGEMYVRYIKNGKPLDKINLVYSHAEKGEYNETYYCFDEMVNEKKMDNTAYRMA